MLIPYSHIVIRTESVRRDLPHKCTLSLAYDLLREHLVAIVVDRGKVARARGPSGDRVPHDQTVHMPGKVHILVLGLQRKRVRIQPTQQILIQPQPNVRRLRRMNVAINESRQQKLSFAQLNLLVRVLLRKRLKVGLRPNCDNLCAKDTRLKTTHSNTNTQVKVKSTCYQRETTCFKSSNPPRNSPYPPGRPDNRRRAVPARRRTWRE